MGKQFVRPDGNVVDAHPAMVLKDGWRPADEGTPFQKPVIEDEPVIEEPAFVRAANAFGAAAKTVGAASKDSE